MWLLVSVSTTWMTGPPLSSVILKAGRFVCIAGRYAVVALGDNAKFLMAVNGMVAFLTQSAN